MPESDEPTAFNPFAPGMAEDPYPTYTALRAKGPLHKLEGLPMYAAVGYDEVVQVLKERGGSHRYDEFQKMRVGPHAVDERYCQGISEFVLMKEGEDHKRVRNAFIRAFTHRRVEAMRAEIEGIANSLIDAIEAQGEAEIIEAFALHRALRPISNSRPFRLPCRRSRVRVSSDASESPANAGFFCSWLSQRLPIKGN